MIIYGISILIISILAYVFRDKKKYFCISSGLVLWLLLALRHIDMGISDTRDVYMPYFNMLSTMPFLEIFEFNLMSDKGFYVIMKIITFFTGNYQICIMLLAIPFIYSVEKLIYKYSKNAFFSNIIFISLYYAYGYFLLRQVIAIGIILFSYKYIREKKIWKFLIIVGIAGLFHRTALIFLIAYPFCNKIKFSNKNFLMILIAYIIANYATTYIIEGLVRFDFTGKIANGIIHNLYMVDVKSSIFGLLITVLILFVSGLYYKKNKLEDDKVDILYGLSTLGSILYCFSSVVTEFYRAALYFSIFNILLLPNAMNKHKDQKQKYLICFMAIIIFIIYFFIRTVDNTNINPYIFFWE